MGLRLLIAGEVRLCREGLARLLADVEHIALVGAASCREETVLGAQTLGPDIVLLDMAMSKALATVSDIGRLAPDVSVVAFAVPDNDSKVIAFAEAGVAGYVMRDGSLDDVIRTIDAAAKGELHCSARIAGSLLRRVAALSEERQEDNDVACLTTRECDILDLVDQNLSNKEIARKLSIEVATVKNHIHNILKKLGVRRRGEAAALMRRPRSSSFRSRKELIVRSPQFEHKHDAEDLDLSIQ